MAHHLDLAIILAFVATLHLFTTGGCFVRTYEMPQIQLEDKSFVITAKLAVSSESKPRYVYDLEETYSQWQSRARLELSLRDLGATWKPDEHFLPHDAIFWSEPRSDNKVLMLLKWPNSCSLATKKELDQLLMGSSLDNSKASIYLGVSQFLQFAQYNRHRTLDITRLPFKTQKEFDYFGFTASNSINYVLAYPKNGASGLALGLPSRLMIFVDEGHTQATYSYSFKRLDMLPEAPVFGSTDAIARSFSMEGVSLSIEALSISRAEGCALYEPESPLERLSEEQYRFTFKAHVQGARTKDFAYHVGYDSSLKSLRVDRIGPTKVNTIFNYFGNLKTYYINRKHQRGAAIGSSSASAADLLHVRADAETEDAGASCVVANTPLFGSYKLGPMLFGSRKFTYLGMAQVRGIEARVYESFNGTYPIWYSQPIQAKRTVTEKDPRTGVEQEKEKIFYRMPTDLYEQYVVSTVVYVSNTQIEEKQPFSGIPLLMEVNFLHKDTMKFVDRLTISIHDFSWSLSKDAPNGQPIEEFYSLGDSCGSPTLGDNHYARLDLELIRDWRSNEERAGEWLKEPARRNLAIMRALHVSASLPSSMLYDIDSHFRRLASGANSEVQSIAQVTATLRLAEHRRDVVDVRLLGKGTRQSGSYSRFAYYGTSTFQHCFHRAAQKARDTLIVYNPLKAECGIYNGRIASVDRTVKEVFTFDADQQQFELYLVYRTGQNADDGDNEDAITSLGFSYNRANALAKIKLLDPLDDRNEFEMELRRIELDELDKKDTHQLEGTAVRGTNKFAGFGLVPTNDEMNQQIQIDPVNAGAVEGTGSKEMYALVSEMSFGHCQAQCLADLECQSFSVCVRGAQIECVLSKVDFRQETLVVQLMQLMDQAAKDPKMRTNQPLYLNLTPEGDKGARVPIVRHPNCEIHNKVYKDLFGKGRKVSVNLLRRLLHPVSNREQCARICVETTLRVLADQAHGAHESATQALENPESDPESVHELSVGFRRSYENICTAYRYFDRTEFLKLDKRSQKLLETRITGSQEDGGATEAYCIVGDKMTSAEGEKWRKWQEPKDLIKEVEAARNARIDRELERYEFDFRFMFELHHGASLALSPISNKLRAVQKNLMSVRGQPVTLKELEPLRAAVAKGENMGVKVMVPSEAECARYCFMQLHPIWPGCKSFDVITTQEDGKRNFHCLLNTISMRDALESGHTELVRSEAQDQAHVSEGDGEKVIQVVHYEPKPGLVVGTLNLVSKLQEDTSYLEDWSRLAQQGGRPLFCLLLCVAALMLGITLGIKMGPEVLYRLERYDWTRAQNKRRDDNENLVDTPNINHLAGATTLESIQEAADEG